MCLTMMMITRMSLSTMKMLMMTVNVIVNTMMMMISIMIMTMIAMMCLNMNKAMNVMMLMIQALMILNIMGKVSDDDVAMACDIFDQYDVDLTGSLTTQAVQTFKEAIRLRNSNSIDHGRRLSRSSHDGVGGGAGGSAVQR